MSDVELVIRIPERIYYGVEKGITVNGSKASQILIDAVANGTPLPKGHGALKDVDELDVTTVTTDDYSGNEVLDVVLKEDIDDAPTIIEADKVESEDKDEKRRNMEQH